MMKVTKKVDNHLSSGFWGIVTFKILKIISHEKPIGCLIYLKT